MLKIGTKVRFSDPLTGELYNRVGEIGGYVDDLTVIVVMKFPVSDTDPRYALVSWASSLTEV